MRNVAKRALARQTARVKPWKSLYGQVLIAIIVGVAVGYYWPHTGAELKPLADAFIKAI